MLWKMGSPRSRGRARAPRGALAERGAPGRGVPRRVRVTGCCRSGMETPEQTGRPRAPQGWVSGEQKTPSGPLRCRERRGLPGCILLADTHSERSSRFPGRVGQMFQLLLSHFAVDGRGVPDSVNRFLTILLVTGGRGPSWGLGVPHQHRSLRPARPRSPRSASRGGRTHKPQKTAPAWEKLLPVSIGSSEKSPSLPKLHVSFTDGAFSSRI